MYFSLIYTVIYASKIFSFFILELLFPGLSEGLGSRCVTVKPNLTGL
jgi:hypothetical protein